MDEKIYNYRYVAQVTIEAVTPLRTASGKSDIFIDSPVLKDWNGLPMILGSSIAGVLRHSFDNSFAENIFGFEKEKEDNGLGSRLIVSNALMCDENGKVHQELGLPQSLFLEKYSNLPVREHTRQLTTKVWPKIKANLMKRWYLQAAVLNLSLNF